MDGLDPNPALAQEDEAARALLLASAAIAYPDEELPALLAAAEAGALLPAALRPLRHAADNDLDGLRQRHGLLFDVGPTRVSLFETEYGRMRGVAKGRDLADISGFYLAFGLQQGAADGREMLDHIAVELEFYATLVLRSGLLAAAGDAEGVAVVRAARAAFLRDHLGRLAPTLAGLQEPAADAVYGPVLTYIAALVRGECAQLDVVAEALEVPPGGDGRAGRGVLADEVICGAGGCLPAASAGATPSS